MNNSWIHTLIIAFLFSSLCILGGCTLEKSVSGKNISFLYKEEQPKLLAESSVVNVNDESTILLRFQSEDFGKSISEKGAETVSYSLRYKVYSNYSSSDVLDSGKVIRREMRFGGQQFIEDSIKIQSTLGQNYLIDCMVIDLNSNSKNTLLIDVYRSQRFNNQSVRLYSSSQELLFTDYVTTADSFELKIDVPRDQLYVKYYERDFPVASPPFSTVAPRPFDFTPTDVFKLRKLSSDRFRMFVSKSGFYQVTDDTLRKTGATYYYFGVSYPEAKTLLDLVQPLRYLTTNDEYTNLTEGGSLKKNVDAYWLNLGGNPQRARELIRAFYSRVQYANKYFTSYVEGWKSDRGMCYIVYGPPDIVYRSTATETWLYGEEGNYNSLSLTFTKVMNPFTSNDFRLNRSGSLKTSWYRAVEYWRQGRVLTYR